MPNVSGYSTKRKPHRVRPHFRYQSKAKLEKNVEAADLKYLRVQSEIFQRGYTEHRRARLVKAGKGVQNATHVLRESYP